MTRKFTVTALIIALALPLSMPEPVQAQNGFLNNLFSTQRGRDRRAAAAARRVEAREIQAALNFFSFDVGTVDGVLGARSRTAMRGFQGALGMPVTGELSDTQKEVLLSGYNEISSGTAEMRGLIADHPEGALGVLKSKYGGTQAPDAPLAAPAPEAPALAEGSMHTLCTTLGATGPQELVKAQFCNLRLLAMEQSEQLLDTMPDPQSRGEVFAKCEVFATSMAPYIGAISGSESTGFIAEISDWAEGTGMPETALSRIAKTCLGTGYSHDSPQVALAALTALSGFSDSAYIEMMGYHIAYGLGRGDEDTPALASAWLESAVEALPTDNIELTGQPSGERAEIIVDLINILAESD